MSSFIVYLEQRLEGRRRPGPDWFPESGLTKLDFDFDYFTPRDIQEKPIRHALLTRGFHIIEGQSASGKTSLLEKLGHDIHKKGHYHVMVLDAGVVTHSNKKQIISELDNLHGSYGERLILLFDDMHRSFEPANEIAHLIIERRIRTIFATRPSFRMYSDVKIRNILLQLEQTVPGCVTKITGDNIQTQIADSALKDYGIPATNDQMKEIASIASGDLWVLKYVLETYRKTKTISAEKVYQSIRERIIELESKSGTSLIEATYLLGLAGIHEIPLKIDSVQALVGPKSVEILLQESLLVKHGERVAFYHTSLGKLFVEAIRPQQSKQNRVNDLAQFLEKYIAMHSDEITLIFKRLCLDTNMLEALLSSKSGHQAIFYLLSNQSKSLSDIADFITDACRQGTNKIAEQINHIINSSVSDLVKKIDEEDSLSEINFFLGSMPWIVPDDMVDKAISINALMEKRQKDGDLGENQCVYHLHIDEQKTHFETVGEILGRDIKLEQAIKSGMGCSRYQNINKAHLCLKSIISNSSAVSKKVLNALDMLRLIQKIESAKDTYLSIKLIHSINWIDRDWFGKTSLQNSSVFEKISSIEDPTQRHYCEQVRNMLLTPWMFAGKV